MIQQKLIKYCSHWSTV